MNKNTQHTPQCNYPPCTAPASKTSKAGLCRGHNTDLEFILFTYSKVVVDGVPIAEILRVGAAVAKQAQAQTRMKDIATATLVGPGGVPLIRGG